MQSAVDTVFKENEQFIKASSEDRRKTAITNLSKFAKQLKDVNDIKYFLTKTLNVYKKVCTAVYMKVVIAKMLCSIIRITTKQPIAEQFTNDFTTLYLSESNEELKRLLLQFISPLYHYINEIPQKLIDAFNKINTVNESTKSAMIEAIPDLLSFPHTNKITQIPLTKLFTTLISSVKSPKTTPKTTIIAFRYLFTYFRQEHIEPCEIMESVLLNSFEKALKVYSHPEFINLIKDTLYKNELALLLFETLHLNCIPNSKECESEIKKLLPIVLDRHNIYKFFSTTQTSSLTSVLIHIMYQTIMQEVPTTPFDKLINGNALRLLSSFVSNKVEDNDIPLLFIMSSIYPQRRKVFNKLVFQIVKPTNKTYEVAKQFVIGNFDNIFNAIIQVLIDNPTHIVALKSFDLLISFTRRFGEDLECGSELVNKFNSIFGSVSEEKQHQIHQIYIQLVKDNSILFNQHIIPIYNYAKTLIQKNYDNDAIELLRAVSYCTENVMRPICEYIGYSNYLLAKSSLTDADTTILFENSKKVLTTLSDGEHMEQPLQPQSFYFLLPTLLWIAYRKDFSTEIVKPQNQVMKIFSMYCSCINEAYPLYEIVNCLNHIILTIPRFVQKSLLCLSQLVKVANEQTICVYFDNLLSDEENTRRYNAVALDNGKQFLKTKTLNHEKLCKLYLGGHDRVSDVSNACKNVMNTIHLYHGDDASNISEEYRIPDQTFVDYFKKDEICLIEDIDIQEMVATAIYSIAKLGKTDVSQLIKETLNEYDNSFPHPSLIPGVEKDRIIIRSKYLRRRFCVFVICKLGAICSIDEVNNILPFLLRKCTKDDEPIPEMVEQLGEFMFSTRSLSDAEKIYEFIVHLKNENVQKPEKEVEMIGIYLGLIAKYFDRANPKFNEIIKELRGLSIKPSLTVQLAVSNCFSQISDLPNLQGILEKMYAQCLRLKDYELKRGVGYAIAGICKAHGLYTFYHCRFYDRFIKKPLDNFEVDNKGRRITSGDALNGNMTTLIILQCLCEIMEDIFEPYVIDIFDSVRPIVGEKSEVLRQQSTSTIRSMTSSLTHHGIGITVPALINGLTSNEWRERQLSCNVLGEMSKQTTHSLNDYLPKIITPIVNLMIDSDYNVSKAASEALNNLASVIKNPEISSLLPSILEALENPPKYTESFYEHFEQMQFTHIIDSSSLALIHYILLRGLTNPQQKIRSKSGILIGSLTNLTDPNDFLPYLDIFLPELKRNITDNDPDVRTAASSAIGHLINFIGEDSFKGLKEWFLENIQSTKSTVHRLGTAQGLAEYYRAVGAQQLLEDFDVICNIESDVITTRQSVMFLLYYFCFALKERFSEFIGKGLLLIVKGLSDSSEIVRDAAMKAGSILVRQYGKTHLKSLLEVLNESMYNDSVKVQECAINLIGELLEGMIGSTEIVTEPYLVLRKKLGVEKIGGCLANLYVIRFDEEHSICQKATLVWKKVIVNAGRALNDLIPYIMEIATQKLCSNEKDRKRAARCIGELVDLFESRIVEELVKTLKEKLVSDNHLERIGACNGFVQIIKKGQTTTFEKFKEVLPLLVEVMCDSVESIRDESNVLFLAILHKFGKPSLEYIMDLILEFINDENQTQKGILGFQTLINKNHNIALIFETLTPKILKTPITVANCKTLLILCESSQQFFLDNFALIMQRGFNSIVAKHDDKQYVDVIRKMMIDICLLYPYKDKLYTILGENMASYQRPIMKIETLQILTSYFISQKDVVSTGADIIISHVLNLIKLEKDESVIPYVWTCFEKMHMFLPNDKFYIYINSLVPMIQDACQNGADANFILPKDIGPLVRVEVDTLKNALTETKEQAIRSLIILLKRYEKDDSFTQHRDNIIGPLINTITKQCESSHKIKLLQLLQTLFETAHHRGKIKTFVLPITITLNKILVDGDTALIKVAIGLYKHLLEYDLKIDTLLKEIQKGLVDAFSTKIEIYLTLIIHTIPHITTDKWKAAYAKPPVWPIEKLYTAVYNQCVQLTSITQDSALLIEALGVLLKFMPDNEGAFKTLISMDVFTTGGYSGFKEKLCDAFVKVCPDKETLVKEFNGK
ncbi:HEAT repeat domain containing protein [Entamoeba marina]